MAELAQTEIDIIFIYFLPIDKLFLVLNGTLIKVARHTTVLRYFYLYAYTGVWCSQKCLCPLGAKYLWILNPRIIRWFFKMFSMSYSGFADFLPWFLAVLPCNNSRPNINWAIRTVKIGHTVLGAQAYTPLTVNASDFCARQTLAACGPIRGDAD